ncbi:helix-turn-helix domain-containing protein [Frigidibacter albus]|uniref:Helix-turn-helix domain-containing protein n=1 Tax=Frigidibacter albus TaxID=1465486 RepID=A0A6L8VFN7_9RHOB|nr:helix-turn-helix domain-containing protein [Frigidibacter albus]MZQ88496.1 helix-turn-helix domain-containing protein [Frigidibacter albus]NBE30695.1 helix-turn-helix domain-containing protein [Frigidibacter albus]GGH48684.1 ArsR family transcriptional regulator [Frigidibacter albus]
MEIKTASESLAVLGHEGRLSVLRLLMRRMPQGARPTEIAEALGMKPNTLSAYLSALEGAGLIAAERQGRAITYTANLPGIGGLIDYLYADCCRGRPDICTPAAFRAGVSLEERMEDRVYNALFICSGNSARSIFAEALLRDVGKGRFNAFSAGTKPHSELNPYALEVLERAGHDVSTMRSKHLSEFQSADAPAMDFVFTVCDAAANEECPPWPGQPITAHWGVADPVKATGTDAEKGLAFSRAYAELRRRIIAFAALQVGELEKVALQRKLDDIGRGA